MSLPKWGGSLIFNYVSYNSGQRLNCQFVALSYSYLQETFTAYNSCKSKFAKDHIHNPNPNPTLLSFTAFFVIVCLVLA